MNLICVHCVTGTVCRLEKLGPQYTKWPQPCWSTYFLSSGHRCRVMGYVLVVSTGMLTVGLRGTSILGCSLLLGEEMTGHLQLPLISRRVRLEPSEKPAGGPSQRCGNTRRQRQMVSSLAALSPALSQSLTCVFKLI